jgi:hypothetical protein
MANHGNSGRAPNLNAYCKRFVRSIKNEALTRMIVIGEASLRYVIQSYLMHYRYELTHQRLNNQLIAPALGLEDQCRRIVRRNRQGGLPSYYYCELRHAGLFFNHTGYTRPPPDICVVPHWHKMIVDEIVCANRVRPDCSDERGNGSPPRFGRSRVRMLKPCWRHNR